MKTMNETQNRRGNNKRSLAFYAHRSMRRSHCAATITVTFSSQPYHVGWVGFGVSPLRTEWTCTRQRHTCSGRCPSSPGEVSSKKKAKCTVAGD